MRLELNTFGPTYSNIIEIAFKMKKYELKYHHGASPTLKVMAHLKFLLHKSVYQNCPISTLLEMC
jgi:hypothetical protein